MRLKFFDKIMLYILLTALSIFSFIVILLAWGAAEPVTISNYTYVLFGSIVNKLILTVLGALIIAVCVRILFVRRPAKVVNEQEEMSHKRGVTVDMGEAGTVFVTYSAIENAVINLVCEEPHVTDCQCVLVPSGDGISIAVKVILNYGAAVTQTSKNITLKLTRDIERRMGIKVYGVKITVDTPVKQPEDPRAKQRSAQPKPIPAQYALNEPVAPAAKPQGYYAEQPPRQPQPRYDYQQPQFDPGAMPFEAVYQAAKAPQQPVKEPVYQPEVAEAFNMEFVPGSAPETAPVYEETPAFTAEPEPVVVSEPAPKADPNAGTPFDTAPQIDPKAGIPFDPMAFLNENAVDMTNADFAEPVVETAAAKEAPAAPQETQRSEGQRRRSRKAQRQAKANENNAGGSFNGAGNDAK